MKATLETIHASIYMFSLVTMLVLFLTQSMFFFYVNFIPANIKKIKKTSGNQKQILKMYFCSQTYTI